MKLNWWETYVFIVFVALFFLSVVIPWLSEKLVYDKLAFGVIFGVAIIVISAWTTFKFSRTRPKRNISDNSGALKRSSPQEYKQVFPHPKEGKKKRVILVVTMTVFLLLLVVYMHQEGKVGLVQDFLRN